MKILVTGSGGFIGGEISAELERCGHNVIGLRSGAVKGLVKGTHKEYVADIASLESLKKFSICAPRCDAIVHAAAALDKDFLASAIPLVNCVGMQNVLWLADHWQCTNFVYMSGVSVIGMPNCYPITESHPVKPNSAYLASKLFGEQMVRLASGNNMSRVTLRITAPVGPGMPMKRLLTTAVRSALNAEIVKLSGHGTRIQNYVDVRDIARATALCIEKNVSGLFNIAGDDSISNFELASRCIERCNSFSTIEFTGAPDAEEGFKWIVSSEKARAVFGYAPKYSVNDAIDAAIAACAERIN